MSVSSVTSTKLFLGGRLKQENQHLTIQLMNIWTYPWSQNLYLTCCYYSLLSRRHCLTLRCSLVLESSLLSLVTQWAFVWLVCLPQRHCSINQSINKELSLQRHCYIPYIQYLYLYMHTHPHTTLSYLKAWMITVPNRMKRAEKIRDSTGIISRLGEAEHDKRLMYKKNKL